MTPELLYVLLMAACFVALVVFAKLPVSLSLVATAVVLVLVAGRGLHLDQLVEGMFGYLDTCLVLFTAMIFMKVIEANGLLGELTRSITVHLGRSPLLLLVALTLIIMFPRRHHGLLHGLGAGHGRAGGADPARDGHASGRGRGGHHQRRGLRHDRAAGERPRDDHRGRHRPALHRLRPRPGRHHHPPGHPHDPLDRLPLRGPGEARGRHRAEPAPGEGRKLDHLPPPRAGDRPAGGAQGLPQGVPRSPPAPHLPAQRPVGPGHRPAGRRGQGRPAPA